MVDKHINMCVNFTLGGKVRLRLIWDLIEKISHENIRGDFLEVGVYKGGQSMMACYAFSHFGMDDRKVLLYDTFEGMTKPSGHDFKINKSFTHETYLNKWEENNHDGHNGWCYSPIQEVRKNLASTGFKNYFLVKGDACSTLKNSHTDSLCILRIDVDFYEATKASLDFMYDKVSNGGYIIFDDYNCWNGAHKAVDEFFISKGLDLSLIKPVDHSCSFYKKVS